MGEEVKVWYDPEADYLVVLFDRQEGYFRQTASDAVMEKVDKNGHKRASRYHDRGNDRQMMQKSRLSPFSNG